MGAEAVLWASGGLVALGILLVLAAVVPLARRARPLRRALRRLSWRREDLERLRTRADGLQDRVATLSEQAQEIARRAEATRNSHP